MIQDSLDHRQVFDAGDDLDGVTALTAMFHIAAWDATPDRECFLVAAEEPFAAPQHFFRFGQFADVP